jgi:hypothetical protein
VRRGSLWHRLPSLLKLIAIGVVVAVEVIVGGDGAVGAQAFTWISVGHATAAAADGIADIGNTLELGPYVVAAQASQRICGLLPGRAVKSSAYRREMDMTLREKLRLVEGGLVDPALLTLKESMERAAKLAADNRRRLTVLQLVVEDAIASLSKSDEVPQTGTRAYPPHVLTQARALVRPDEYPAH